MTERVLHGTRSSLKRGTSAVVLMLTLVACGGAAQAPASATPSQPPASAAGVPTVAPSAAASAAATGRAVLADACGYLIPDEVAAAVGMGNPLPVPSADDLYTYCTYSAPGAPELKIFVTKSAETASTAFNTAKANDGEAVSGVGDEAYWSTDSFLPGLYFLKDGVLAYISGPASGPDDRIIELGKLLAERIAEVN
jgi:hypothetical protein